MGSEVQGQMKGEISTEEVPRMHVEWQIPEDILLLPRDTEHRIHSPSFDFKDAAWYFRLKFHASHTLLADTIDLHIVKKYPVSSRFRVIYHIGIKTTSGNKYRSFRGDRQNMDETDLDCWGQTRFLSRSNLYKNKTFLTHNGVMKVFCYFWVDNAVSSPSVSRPRSFRSIRMASEISENIGEISTEVVHTMYIEWKVPGIPLLSEDTEHRFSSSNFQFKDEVWYLQATILNKDFKYDEWCGPIDIHLMRMKSDSRTLYVEYTIGLKLVDGKIYKAFHTEYVFDGTTDDCSVLTNLVSRLDENVIQAPNGKVTFFCYFRVESPSRSNAGSKKMLEDYHATCRIGHSIVKFYNVTGTLAKKTAVPTVSSPSTLNWTPEKPNFSSGASKLSEDLKNLFISGEDSDLSIKVKDTEFKVHKIFLRARSSVFRSMLSNDMMEKNSGIIDIADFEPEAFKIFFLHLYNGCVENLSTDTVYDVYRAAEKYDIEELKPNCKDFMLANLAVDTVCDVIGHALQYNEQELLKTATDFFAKNFKDIILTVKWQIFLQKNAAAANELLIKASNYYALKE